MNHRNSIRWAALLPLLLANMPLSAATDWRHNRLIPLEKVTVGPSDSYQASVDSSGGQIFFTHSQNQIAQIYRQKLTSGEAERLLPADSDGKDPQLSPDRQSLLLTSFRHDAQGDICLTPLSATGESGELRCLTTAATSDQSPFWIDFQRIGYIRRSLLAPEAELVMQNLTTQQVEVVAKGEIAAATASRDGRLLLYHLGGKGFYLHDLSSGQVKGSIQFDLPGRSSYAQFSPDGRWLYFGHYLNDTSADQTIDGDDTSVVFRVAVAALQSATAPLLPEQLISLGQNCNFPTVTADHLYVTCAYEGSLDIYRLPPAGVVPANWNEEQLWSAHANARSHEDRLLLLNTLRFRYGLNDIAMLERLLSHHLELGEWSAAREYVATLQQRLQSRPQPELAHFYHNLDRLLQALAAKRQQPPGLITARFRRQIEQWQQQLLPAADSPAKAIFRAYFAHLLDDAKQALAELAAPTRQSERLLPLEFYLAIELHRQLLANQPIPLLPLLLQASHHQRIELESRLYYAFEYLRLLTDSEPDSARRKAHLTLALAQQQEPKIRDLFLNELDLLAMIESRDPDEQKAIFNRLSQRLKGYREEQDIRRIAHIRAIVLLGAAEQYELMELMSRHWLTIAHVSEMAFVDIAEQYSVVTVNKGYGLLVDGDPNSAANTFYSAIRQTNDLEAHYHYLILGLTGDSAMRQRLQKAYATLNREGLVGVNQRYVEALSLLVNDPLEQPQTLQKAVQLLEELRPVGLSPALRDLLLAYGYQRQLEQSQSGHTYDKGLYQKAHYHYMLALDHAYDHQRVQAAVLENLGKLHFQVGHYALARDFLTQRARLPFATPEAEAWLRWQFARALFYANSLPEAAQQAERGLQLATEAKITPLTPFQERAAFYAVQAGDYTRAAALYPPLLAADGGLDPLNRAKATLGYGYALLKLNQPEAATESFRQLLAQSGALKPLPATPDRPTPFEPQRLQLLAYGFLAQLSRDPAEQRRYQQQRLTLLQSLTEETTTLGYDAKGRLELIAKLKQQMVLAYEQSGLLPQMVQALQEGLELIPLWLKEEGGYDSPLVLRTLTNTLSLALLYPDNFRGVALPQLAPLLDQTVKALTLTPYTPPMSGWQRLQLQLLQLGYRQRVEQTLDRRGLAAEITTLQHHPDWQSLLTSRPDLAEELVGLVAWLLPPNEGRSPAAPAL